MRSAILTFLATALVTTAAYPDCRYSAPRQISSKTDGITAVHVVGRAGSLRVTGVAGATDIRATGTACAGSKDMLDRIRLTAKREGSVLRIEAEMPESDIVIFGFSTERKLDFVVEVPAGMAAEVDDGSGDLEVAGVGKLRVDDGSGDVEIRDIRGSVRIDDGSGDLEVSNVAGTVEVDDGSGDITIRGAAGVRIADDGSGDIDIRNVKSDVRVDDDGSGSIYVADVGGNFIVSDDGSGGIKFHNVAGRVQLPKD